MRFVPVKTAEQQATALLHRGREQLVRQRTMLVNALRATSGGVRNRGGAGLAQCRRADCHCSAAAGLAQDQPGQSAPLVVAVALANKTARIAWAVMLREKEYQPTAVAA